MGYIEYSMLYIEFWAGAGREAGRQAERQAGRQRGRQPEAGGQAERQTNKIIILIP